MFTLALGLSVLIASAYPIGLELLFLLFSPTALRTAFGAPVTIALMFFFKYLLLAVLLYLVFRALKLKRKFNFRADGRRLLRLGIVLALLLAVLEWSIDVGEAQSLAAAVGPWLALIRPIAFFLALTLMIFGLVRMLAAQSMPKRLVRKARWRF